jgi:hypothetical protein
MENHVSIDVGIIAHITRFPSWGMDFAQFLDDKSKQKTLAEEMKKKYSIDRGT